MNGQIMKQVSVMKEAIKESRESEILNRELLEKVREKSEKIHNLKQIEKQLKELISSKDLVIEQLQDRLCI